MEFAGVRDYQRRRRQRVGRPRSALVPPRAASRRSRRETSAFGRASAAKLKVAARGLIALPVSGPSSPLPTLLGLLTWATSHERQYPYSSSSLRSDDGVIANTAGDAVCVTSLTAEQASMLEEDVVIELANLISRHARYRGDAIALVFEDRRLTWRDFAACVAQVGNLLRGLGIDRYGNAGH